MISALREEGEEDAPWLNTQADVYTQLLGPVAWNLAIPAVLLSATLIPLIITPLLLSHRRR